VGLLSVLLHLLVDERPLQQTTPPTPRIA